MHMQIKKGRKRREERKEREKGTQSYVFIPKEKYDFNPDSTLLNFL